MGSLKSVSQKTRPDFGQEPVPSPGFPTIPPKLGVKEGGKRLKIAFSRIWEGSYSHSSCLFCECLGDFNQPLKIPEQKDRTFPSIPNPRI